MNLYMFQQPTQGVGLLKDWLSAYPLWYTRLRLSQSCMAACTANLCCIAQRHLRPADMRMQAEQLMEMNGLQNTYFLAKNLTERLVAAADNNPHRVCILRPSIVGCVSRAPYPGFVGNSSGFTAAILGASAGRAATLVASLALLSNRTLCLSLTCFLAM